MRLLWLLPVTLFLLLSVMLAIALKKPASTSPSPLLNQPLPAFSLPALYEHDSGISTEQLRGHYALINVFASWCVSCEVEHSTLMTVTKKYALPLYGLNWKDDNSNAKTWLKKRGNPYKAIGVDKEGKTAIDLGVTGAPETFLINPEGIIIYRYAGALTHDIIAHDIMPLITP